MSDEMFVTCQVCEDNPAEFPVSGRTTSNAATIGDMLSHHALLHDEDATVEFVVSVRSDV